MKIHQAKQVIVFFLFVFDDCSFFVPTCQLAVTLERKLLAVYLRGTDGF